jgi:hypothetical protein
MSDPWVNDDGSTNVDGFLAAYEVDDNVFWAAANGHVQNVLDEVIERAKRAQDAALQAGRERQYARDEARHLRQELRGVLDNEGLPYPEWLEEER